MKNFILWRLELDDKGKQRKIPYSALYEGRASTTNPKTWTSYEKAMKALKIGEYSGIGFVLDKGITFIDLDHCRSDNGTLTPLAENITNNFQDTFIEISQSGKGLHIFTLGTVGKAVKTKDVEIYSTGRYAALTGNAVTLMDLADGQSRIDTLYKFCMRGKSRTKSIDESRHPQCVLPLSEREIIEKAKHSKGGDVFTDLLNGNWEYLRIGDGSQSSADLRFANALAFWCQCDTGMMRNIFRNSKMYRDNRKMNLAVTKAIADCNAVYQGRR